MALSAVLKVLKHGLISEDNVDAAEAMHCIGGGGGAAQIENPVYP
jgi:hypothetical protein